MECERRRGWPVGEGTDRGSDRHSSCSSPLLRTWRHVVSRPVKGEWRDQRIVSGDRKAFVLGVNEGNCPGADSSVRVVVRAAW